MRGSRKLLAIASVALTACPAAAEELPRDVAPVAAERSAGAVGLAARSAVGRGPNSAFLLAGVEAGYRLTPHLVLGGAVQATLLTLEGSGDHCAYYGQCAPSFQRLATRAELHLVPDFVIDPWAAVAPGLAWVEAGPESAASLVAEIAVEGGIDLRLSRQLALGAFVGLTRTVQARSDYGDNMALGLRAAFAFGASAQSVRPGGDLARRF